jgi:hypothetical protein
MTRTPSGLLRVEELEAREVPAILFGVTPANVLVTFDSAAPTDLLRAVRLTGLSAAGEVVTDIDVRPATGGLYGHSNLGQLYQIDPLSGFARRLGTPIGLGETNLGFDFDPRTDQVRMLTNAGQNLVREPVFGVFIRRANTLTYSPGDVFQGFAPRVTGAAFFNNVPDPVFRALYGIDHARNALVRVGGTTLDDGLLRTVGGLGRDVTGRVGLDIAPVSNVLFASLQVAGQAVSRLYTLNYATGRAVPVGRIGGGLLVNDIAVDLRGISGFQSAAGFGVFAPPAGSGFSFNNGNFNFSFDTGAGAAPATTVGPFGTGFSLTGFRRSLTIAPVLTTGFPFTTTLTTPTELTPALTLDTTLP